MIQVLPKWRVTVVFASSVRRTFYVHDFQFANALTKASAVSFDEDVIGMTMELVPTSEPKMSVDSGGQ